MKWLLVAVIVLAQQPAKVPRDKRIAEANRTVSAASAKNTASNQANPAQTTPTPTQLPVEMEGQRNSATADSPTQTNGKQTSDDDRATQHKLTWFTEVLAGVGVGQLAVMFITWLVYRRQAIEMRKQRHIGAQQRHVMWRQWKAMREQLAEIQSSGELAKETAKTARIGARASLRQMELAAKTDEVSKSSVEASQRTADAAYVSARAAMGIAVPTLRVHMFNIVGSWRDRNVLATPRFQLTVKNFGNSPAFVRGVLFWAGIEPESADKNMESYPIETNLVVTPNETKTFYELGGLPYRIGLVPRDVDTILDQRAMLSVRGSVHYEDNFESPIRRLNFWATALNLLPDGSTEWFIQQSNEYDQPKKPHTSPDDGEKVGEAN